MKKRRNKTLGYLVVIGGIGMLIILCLTATQPFAPAPRYGVTFSVTQAQGLGLDWHEVYQALLSDLGVRRLRLVAYWDQIEPAAGQFDFTALDYQMDQAAAFDAKVILSIGRKLPRWPECHVPAWAQNLSEADQRAKVLVLLEHIVRRYDQHPALRMWQLENEPFLSYGRCPPVDPAFLEAEQNVVRSLSAAPLLITDSGELNWWLTAGQYGDQLGTTMYRTVFSSRTNRLFHYDYLFPAWLYRAKARLVHLLYGKPVIIVELQGEPWGRVPTTELTEPERQTSFSAERFREVEDFAARTQLPEAYWWGSEYWYWEKVVNNNPEFWEVARTIFASDTTASND